MSQFWYVAQCFQVIVPERLTPSFDPSVSTTPLRYRYAERNLRAQGFQTYCPAVLDTVTKRNQQTKTLRALFPNYIFVMFSLADTRWRGINYTRGVRHLLPSQSELPIAVPEGFVEALKGAESIGEVDEELPRFAFNAVVRIIAGPFSGYIGRVLDSGRSNTRVQIEAFAGREIPVSVATGGLELVTA